MGGTNAKLAQKLARRAKYVKQKLRGRKFDEINKLEVTLKDSYRAYQLVRKEQRRMDRNWEDDTIGQKPVLSFEVVAPTVTRVSIGGGHFAIQLTLASGLESFIGLQPGDVVQFREGRAKGQQLAVTTLVNSTHVNLQDYAAYLVLGLPQKTSITCVADVAGSLNDKYFYINSANNVTQYYVWYNVNSAGTDPAIGGKTGVMVALATGATSTAVATATAAALAGVSGTPFTTTQSLAVVMVTDTADGPATTPTDAGATGFTLMVTQAGTADSSSETNIDVLCFLSSEKGTYY